MPLPRSALVSGVTGFIGAALASRLIDEGLQVFGLVRAGSRQVHRIESLTGLTVVEVADCSREELRRSLASVRTDIVFNLAAAGVQPGERDPNDLLGGNAGPLLNLLDCIGDWRVSRFLHTSSCSEYGPVVPGVRLQELSPLEPSTMYGAAKLAAWQCGRLRARQLGVPFLTLRVFGCFGPGEAPQRLVPYTARKLAAGEPVDLTPGDQVRDFLHVDDVVDALWSAVLAPEPVAGKVFNVCSGEGTSVRALVRLLAEVLDRPESLLHWGARPARADEPLWIVGDPAAFRQATGWAPRLSLRSGLERTVRDLIGRPEVTGRREPEWRWAVEGTIPTGAGKTTRVAPARKLLSIVVPVLNEEHNIPRLYQAVRYVMANLASRYDWELIFTDNHSTDRSFELLRELAAQDRCVRVIRFSRNFGYQRSILTGYLASRGDAVIQLDCDLQDSPELIYDFLSRWQEGYQVVYGVRRGRQEGWAITAARKAFYRLINALSEHELPLDAGDFRLVDRRVVEELRKIDDASPYLRGTIAALGFRQVGVPYDRSARTAGASKFQLRQLVGLAVDGILNHSMAPLRLATYLSGVLLLLTLVFSAVYVVGKVVAGSEWPAGFATLALLVLLSMSVNAFFFGLMGEYLGRIFRQVKRGPVTVVEAELNRPGNQDCSADRQIPPRTAA